MKKTIKLVAAILLVSFTFTSCDDVEDLIDVDFKSSISGKYNLNFEAESEEKISESLTLNLADNSDVSKYLSKLKEVEITKITYEITKFTGDNNVDMNVGFYMNGNTIVAPTEYNLSSELGVVFEITDKTVLNTVSSTLLSSKKVVLDLKGEYLSMAAATAELTVVVYFNATANPL
ncbi:hypothetical protein ACFQ5N_03205 [Lutibacter holmesii]|uniref:DUF4840 domain-containing protein n=1 Tax=Lutibacter holmesii TaxID=1137985 RepID=A0ABW3WKU4_9FLAO